MEVVFILLPLVIGPFLLAYGLVQLVIARLTQQPQGVPLAHVVTGLPLEDERGSWRERGKRNVTFGLFMTVCLVLLTLSFLEAAS